MEAAGFTLIELCIAAGVMSVCFLFLIGGVIDISDSNEVITDRTVAQSQLASTLEQMRSLSFDALVLYQAPAFAGLGQSATISFGAIDGTGTAAPLPITNAATSAALPNPVEIRATILWRDARGRLHSETSASLFRR